VLCSCGVICFYESKGQPLLSEIEAWVVAVNAKGRDLTGMAQCGLVLLNGGRR
jgi:hypothetical protein